MNRIVVSLGMIAGLIFTAACDPAASNTASNNRPANAANNAAAPSTANADADIKKIMTELASELAKNDADAVAKHYADDYHLVGPFGDVQTKAQRIADMKSGASKFETFSYNDINVRTYGDTAVAITTVKVKGKVAGREAAPESRATLVFKKMGDTWKVVSGQATPIAAAPANTAAANKPAANTAANTNAAKPPPPANKY